MKTLNLKLVPLFTILLSSMIIATACQQGKQETIEPDQSVEQSTISSNQSTGEQSIAEESTAEQTAGEQSTVEQATVGESTVEESAGEQTTVEEGLKDFTSDELAKYNGKNDNPAYIAVDGKVYDVTDVPEWKNGIHNRRFEAGKDLTKELKLSPHGSSKLDNVPIVGKLVQ